MDETITATKGTLQETGQSSEGKNGITSTDQTQTYTEDQVAKRISDELAKAGRDAKSLATKEATLKAQEDALKADKAKVDEWQAERDRDELEAAKDSPELLTLHQRKQALRQTEARLAEAKVAFEQEKQTHAEELATARETMREVTIWEIAGTDLNPVKLKEACDKLGATTEEQIKVIADSLRPLKTEAVRATEALKVDSSVTTGGGTGDSAFWKAYGEPGFVATPEDHKRAKQIRDKAMQGG